MNSNSPREENKGLGEEVKEGDIPGRQSVPVKRSDSDLAQNNGNNNGKKPSNPNVNQAAAVEEEKQPAVKPENPYH